MSETRLQDEYNREIRQCDIFVSLFSTKTGKFTEEEFDVAREQFLKTGAPLIYTFFKTGDVQLSTLSRADIESLWGFQDKLKSLGHFWKEYASVEQLQLQFREQLDRLVETRPS